VRARADKPRHPKAPTAPEQNSMNQLKEWENFAHDSCQLGRLMAAKMNISQGCF
jgi:hypothetical protein